MIRVFAILKKAKQINTYPTNGSVVCSFCGGVTKVVRTHKKQDYRRRNHRCTNKGCLLNKFEVCMTSQQRLENG